MTPRVYCDRSETASGRRAPYGPNFIFDIDAGRVVKIGLDNFIERYIFMAGHKCPL